MKVTKEQKVYVGVLLIGLVAFGLDRTIFTPSSAEAADSSSDLLVSKPSPGAHPAAAPKAAVQSNANPISHKLTELSESLHVSGEQTKDAFEPSLTWQGKTAGGAVADTRGFEQTHHLNGVMVGRFPAAMIDGKLVAVGQVLDGYKLVSVTHGAATFQSGETQVTLHGR